MSFSEGEFDAYIARLKESGVLDNTADEESGSSSGDESDSLGHAEFEAYYNW